MGGVSNRWTGKWTEPVEWTMEWTRGFLHTADDTIF